MTASRTEAEPSTYSATEVARMCPGTRPRDISDAFYGRRLDVERCPVIRGRRRIPEDYLPDVLTYLRRRQAER
jgi:hypothetical protein